MMESKKTLCWMCGQEAGQNRFCSQQCKDKHERLTKIITIKKIGTNKMKNKTGRYCPHCGKLLDGLPEETKDVIVTLEDKYPELFDDKGDCGLALDEQGKVIYVPEEIGLSNNGIINTKEQDLYLNKPTLNFSVCQGLSDNTGKSHVYIKTTQNKIHPGERYFNGNPNSNVTELIDNYLLAISGAYWVHWMPYGLGVPMCISPHSFAGIKDALYLIKQI